MTCYRLLTSSIIFSNSPTEVLLRKSGKQYYNTEEALVEIKDDRVTFRPEIAEKYGLEVWIVHNTTSP